MPSYNQSHFIVEAVRSVLAQDDPNWELWIVDNSSDNTPDVMREFSEPRIRFNHIPARMDPGSCLNWMLERATGRDFSYVHTDNNLHPAYVRTMRAALASHPLALAYCDMRTIDEQGSYRNVYKRGSFDLARLLSVDSLGVPFAATTELAKAIGGFSSRDFADDVRFCVSAYGLAQYQYVPDALIDYRLHRASRTEEAGGSGQIQRVFLDLMPKLVPLLEQRGVRALDAMEAAIRQGFIAADLIVQDAWYRKLSRRLQPWWRGFPKVDHFFFNGLLDIKGFSRSSGRPPLRFKLQGDAKIVSTWPWWVLLARIQMYGRRRELRRTLTSTRNLLVSWAAIKLRSEAGMAKAIRICSLDFRTVWAARQLELALGITPLIDRSVVTVPLWLGWARAVGNEPSLDCSEGATITP
jgi:hypothetical protein